MSRINLQGDILGINQMEEIFDENETAVYKTMTDTFQVSADCDKALDRALEKYADLSENDKNTFKKSFLMKCDKENNTISFPSLYLKNYLIYMCYKRNAYFPQKECTRNNILVTRFLIIC